MGGSSQSACERFREINAPATMATAMNANPAGHSLKIDFADAKQRGIDQRASENPVVKLHTEALGWRIKTAGRRLQLVSTLGHRDVRDDRKRSTCRAVQEGSAM